MIISRAALGSPCTFSCRLKRSVLVLQNLHRTLFTKSTLPFPQLASSPTSKYQIFLSSSHNPFYNLSLEHYLIHKASPQSTILLLYVNDPCVVIGRYQNPWNEVNFPALRQGSPNSTGVPLLRRRSGGGTVFHDRQNLNYCVIWPSAVLDRMKHAKMVARAIRKFNPRARVNERHDIVLDQGNVRDDSTDGTTEGRTGFELYGEALAERPALKISGSAFRQTRGRAMHHGTCLVCSKNLKSIGMYLRSPGKGFIKAGGVKSVQSPVGNVLDPDEAHPDAIERLCISIVAEFQHLYGLQEDVVGHLRKQGGNEALWIGDHCVFGRMDEVDDECLQKGTEELQSYDWIYGKTGQISQFHVSSHLEGEEGSDRPSLPDDWPPGLSISFAGRYGAIVENSMKVSGDSKLSSVLKQLESRAFNDVLNFETELSVSDEEDQSTLSMVGRWLNQVFGKTA